MGAYDDLIPEAKKGPYEDLIPPEPGLLANLASAANAAVIGGPQMTAAAQTYIPGMSGYGKTFAENLQSQQAANRQVVSGHPVLSTLMQGAEAIPEAVATAGMGPVGRAGLLANSLIEAVAKNAILGGISGGLHGATNVPGWREAISEGLKGGYEGAAVGGGVTLAGKLAGKVLPDITSAKDIWRGVKKAGSWIDNKLAGTPPPPPVAIDPMAPIRTPSGHTMDSPLAQKNEAYQRAYDLGAAYRPSAFNELVDSMVSDAKKAHINPVEQQGSAAFLDTIQQDAARVQQTGQPITLEELDRWRKAIPSSGNNAAFGRQFRDRIDEFVQKPGVLATPTPEAAEAIQSARQANQVYEKSNALNDILKDKTNIQLRNSRKNFDSSNRLAADVFQKNQYGLTPLEQQQAQHVVAGGGVQNALQDVGKIFAPRSNPWMGGAELLGTVGMGALGHGATSFAPIGLGLGGELAKAGAARMSKANMDRLLSTVLRGGKQAIPLPSQSRTLWEQRLYNPLMQQRQNIEDQYNAP